MGNEIMNHNRTVSSNAFGPGAQIRQGDTVIHNYNSSAQPKARHIIPFGRNEDIIHRPKIVARLDRLLSPAKEGEYCCAALWGLGGSGKTQIALDYAYRRSRDDPACAIFWVHADNETTFERDYRTIARKLDLDNKLSSEELLFKVCDCIESQPRWLLILDSADDLAQFGVGSTLDQEKSLAKYIPQGPGGSVLWTSRDKRIIALAGPRRGVEITRMIVKEAEKLLAVTRNKKIHNDEIQDARLLLEELQCLPLAISQAGSYMGTTSTPIKKYLSRILKGKSRWEVLQSTGYDKYRRPGIRNSILETWDISLERIRQESEMAYKILHTIAYFDNQNISFSMMLTILAIIANTLEQETSFEEKKKALKKAIIRLEEFSLISARKTEDDEPSFDMHKLIQEAIRYRLNQMDGSSGAYFFGIVVSVIVGLFPESKPETWSICEKYASHAIRVSDWTETTEGEIFIRRAEPYYLLSSCLGRVSSYLYDRGLWSQAVILVERELDIQMKILGEEHPVTIFFMCKLSIICLRQGLYQEGEKFGLRALRLSETARGEKDPIAMTMMNSVMLIYFHQGRFIEAEALQTKALSLLQEVCGEKHPDTIKAMSDLAAIYDGQGLLDKAMKLNAKALALCYEVLGEQHCVTLEVFQGLALRYMGMKEYKEAEKLQQRVLSLQQRVHGEQHPNTINAMEILAHIYHCQGRYVDRRELQSKIFLQQQELRGEKHPDTISAMMDLALAYCLEGKFFIADELQVKALSLFHEVLGEKHAKTISAMGTAAFIYRQQGLYKKGDELEKRAVFLRQEVYGGRSPIALRNIDGIAAKRRTAAFTKRRKWTPIGRRMAAFIRRKTALSTKRRKEAPINRKMAAFIKRRTASTIRGVNVAAVS